MWADATPFVVGQIRRVSPALHGEQRRPPSRRPSTFQTVPLGTSANKGMKKGRDVFGPGPRLFLLASVVVGARSFLALLLLAPQEVVRDPPYRVRGPAYRTSYRVRHPARRVGDPGYWSG